ncbi:MAG: hypothetical protein IPH53_22845 [Flavobacteriales bacterium]|nr:hypothetical protein [Flavobacteriales bacterium]
MSYGRRFVAQHDMRIAILPLGYADGLDRKLGHGVGRLDQRQVGTVRGHHLYGYVHGGCHGDHLPGR